MRRILAMLSFLIGVAGWLIVNPESYERIVPAGEGLEADGQISKNDDTKKSKGAENKTSEPNLAINVLAKLEVKGRAPKTGYTREKFYQGWPEINGCSLRQRILLRELGDSAKVDEKCAVTSGSFVEPYTGAQMSFSTKTEISKALQIDHVVALSDAWQKGAQYKSAEIRYSIATDPLNLIAADGPANMQKGDGDAATWLPPNKSFRCQYVARQIAVKAKYQLWVTEAESTAMQHVLSKCPGQTLPDGN